MLDSKVPILINGCYGGFRFSDEFKKHYKEKTGVEIKEEWNMDVRCDEEVIKEIFSYGPSRDGVCAKIYLHVFRCDKSIKDFIQKNIVIKEYDGSEDVEINNYNLLQDIKNKGLINSIDDLNLYMGHIDEIVVVDIPLK